MTDMGRPPKKDRAPFGQRLVAARQEAGLTQQELADKVGVTQRVIAYWERESVSLKIEQLVALADALATSVDYLLGREAAGSGGGPKGKARRLFEEVSDLPKYQQQRVLSTVEDMLTARKAKRAS